MTDIYLNGATIMTTPTQLQMEIARAAGFSGIEARAERLLEHPEEVTASSQATRPGHVWSLNGVRIGLTPDGDLEQRTLEADLSARLEICRAIHAGYLLVVPPRVAGLDEAAALPGVRNGLAVARGEVIMVEQTSGVRIIDIFKPGAMGQ